jgi:PelA/Pel-15E family pectate lyase
LRRLSAALAANLALARRALSEVRFMPGLRSHRALFMGVALGAVVVSLAGGGLARAQGGGRGRFGGVRWPNVFGRDDAWYSGDEAKRIADNLLLYQASNGGWPKNIDMARTLSDAEKERLARTRDEAVTIIDNGATHTQIRYLAIVHKATGEQKYADAAQKGVEFLLAAQYPNGGWPMIFPLLRVYYSHITYNDGAMIGVMRVLKEIGAGKPPYEFFDQSLRDRANAAIAKGLDVILKTQVVIDGKPTVWCAQHDESDFKPAKARAYELPTLSGQESVGIVEYLMDVDKPSPEIKAAIRGAIAWFEKAKITGMRVVRVRAPDLDPPRDVVMVEDPDAGPLWGRFYDIATSKPIYVGRDGVPHDKLADIEHERRVGYAYVGSWPRDLLEREYPEWQKKWGE